MPKIFEYLGLVIFFYSNENEPVHVHAAKGEYESKAEFEIIDSRIHSITIKPAKGQLPLAGSDLTNFKIFLETFGDAIIEKWIDYFVYHKKITDKKNHKENQVKIKEEHKSYSDYIKIVNASYVDHYKIEITFSNTVKHIVDFEPFLKSHKHPDIQKYLDKKVFKSFSILNGNLNWNDYEMIFPISDLYNNSLEKPME